MLPIGNTGKGEPTHSVDFLREGDMTMSARNLSKIFCLSLVLAAAVLFCFSLSAEAGKREGEAVVKANVAEVYSGPSASSEVMRSLKKGTLVSVEIEMEGADGSWCGIAEQGQSITGYVLCRQLERKTSRVTWKSLGRKSTGRVASPAEEGKTTATEKPKRPYSDITVLLYMTTW
jgi:uncharacterized protein YraI